MSSNGNGRGPRVPNDLEAEASVLGAMFCSAEAASTAVRLVRTDQFFRPAHQHIFAAASQCYVAGEGVDVVTVAHRLDVAGMLEVVGGKGALMDLVADTPAISNVGRYISIVTEAAQRRGIIMQASVASDAAQDWTKPLSHAYDLLSPPADINLGNRYDAHVRTAAELMSMPPPSWLIHSVIPSGALMVTYGPPKSAKTFLALHEALCIATGIPMFGNQVQRQRVMYVVAEGVRAFGQRIAAWCEWHRIERESLDGWIMFVDVPVPLLDGDAVNDLKAKAADFGTGYLTLDTLARCMVGADENSGKDMSQAVAAMDELRSPTCAVQAVHHTGKNVEQGMRGHSSLLGAVDTAVEVVGDRTALKVTMTAQKDGEPQGAWWGKLVRCLESVVIQETGRPEDTAEVSRETYAEAISEVLSKNPDVSYTGRDVTDAVKGKAEDIRAALKWLVSAGYVKSEKRKGSSGAVDHTSISRYYRPAPVVPPADDEPF